jgi:glycosyltransferase involved in cell wall biosynthesis
MSVSTMHVITSLHGGGAERLLTNLVTQQSSTNGHAYVVCLQGEGVFLPTVEAAGVEVIDLGIRHRRNALDGLFRLAKLIRKRRPAVVQGWMYPANVFASLALCLAGRRGTQLIWGIFCSDICSSQYPWKNLFRRLGKLFSPYVDGIIYNAGQARDFHHSFGFREPRWLVIPNCLDTKKFSRDPCLRQPVRRELGVPDDAIMVVTVARVDPMKNWAGVLDAVRDIPGVITVGVGKGTDELPQQPGFIGLGWRDDVQHLLSAADIFLLASVFGEGTSMALVEAMSCSLPCVVTDVGGNSTIIGDAGIVVPPRHISPIRDALLRLAGDSWLREEMGRAAQARISTGHSADDVATMCEGFSKSNGGAA